MFQCSQKALELGAVSLWNEKELSIKKLKA